ncbi:IS21 family transposase [bacterium AH-315-L21]|nr:IS21 family transposase [bacterium AH-315-L21]
MVANKKAINSLTDDLKSPRKQRHTAVRVYNRLVEEHGFTRGKRTVADYVSKKKKELSTAKEGYLPIAHPAGEAQLDFGEMMYRNENKKEKKGHYLTLSFPYSNAAYTQIFESENQECVIEGLKRIFEYIGGVPKLIVMDNMSSVVAKILTNGERKIAEGFQRFALHYRFNMRFCNVASGNEKGNIENKIGYHRRNMFVPIPKTDNLEKYNKTLWKKADDEYA